MMHRSCKPALTLAIAIAIALCSHVAMADTALSIQLLPTFNEKREVFGEWEDPGILYAIKNTSGRKVRVRYQSKDGVTVYLRDSAGQVRKVASAWGEAEGFGADAPLPTYEVEKDVNVSVSELNIAHLFGKLKPGKYTVVVEMEGGRFSVDGKRLEKLVTAPWQFEVVTLTPALKKKIDEPTKLPAGVALETVKTENQQGDAQRALKLVNRSKKTIAYNGYEGNAAGITMTEYFCGDGQWRWQFMGLCGTGLIDKHLKPGESAIVGFTSIKPIAPQKGTVSITRPVIGISIVGEENAYHTIAAKPVVYLGE